MDWLGLIAILGLVVTLIWLSLKCRLDAEAFGKLADVIEAIVDAVKDPPEEKE